MFLYDRQGRLVRVAFCIVLKKNEGTNRSPKQLFRIAKKSIFLQMSAKVIIFGAQNT